MNISKNSTDEELMQFINEEYDELVKILLTEEDLNNSKNNAWNEVAKILGHGKDRWDLYNIYIINDSDRIIGTVTK